MITLNETMPLANGAVLDTSPAAFGELKRSDDLLDNPSGFRERLDTDGYVYLPGFWERSALNPVRTEIAWLLLESGCIDAVDPMVMRCLHKPDVEVKKKIAAHNQIVREFLLNGKTRSYLTDALGGSVKALDFLGMRMLGPGAGTYPHGDIVYFSRGTPSLLTGWTPIGDIPIELGGLVLLEGSLNHPALREDYLNRDVDSYCSNHPDAAVNAAKNGPVWDGTLSSDFVALRERLGGRWLTANYRQGDIVIFQMTMIHGSLDNQTDRVRVSADPRYQMESQTFDHRYIGDDPIANSSMAKQGRIC